MKNTLKNLLTLHLFIALLTLMFVSAANADPLWPARKAPILAEGATSDPTLTKKQVEDQRKVLNANILANEPTELFRAGEFQVDVFGAASVADLESIEDADGGAGLGINYFFTRHVGVGYEARHSLKDGENFMNQMAASLFFRFPIGHVSPYVFAGAGYRYQDHGFSPRYHAGAGIEFRLNAYLGLFSDVRFVQKDLQFNDFADAGYVGRAGIRLSF
jgi:hypothetical protein